MSLFRDFVLARCQPTHSTSKASLNSPPKAITKLPKTKLAYFRILFLIYFILHSLNLISKERMYGHEPGWDFYDNEDNRRRLNERDVKKLRLNLYSCDKHKVNFATLRLPQDLLLKELERAIGHGDRSLAAKIADELARRTAIEKRMI
uniref:Uncharacterized protein n=1 Tax=Percolomonas cosmopolitus TaxID=63605 RepID=A0A7S1KTR4_9EUKA